MKNEKLIPSLIEEQDSLPKRGGRYVSQKEQAEKEMRNLQQKIRDLSCNCNCNCDCDCHDCNC